MDYLSGLQVYAVVSAALAGTSYLTIFRPSIELLEEIVEDKTLYSGWLGFIMWNILASIVSPWTAYILLKNNNEEFIEQFAVRLAERIIEEDE